MKKKIITVILCLILVVPMLSITTIADPGAQLEVSIIYAPGYILRNGELHTIGFIIYNNGDEIVRQISITFTVTGGYNNLINYSYSEFFGDLPVGWVIPREITDVRGFGLVTITLSVSANNVDDITVVRKGLQLGQITWIPFSLIKLNSNIVYNFLDTIFNLQVE